MKTFGCEVLVIGGGVVGLALSRLLAQTGREVALVEQGSRFGSVTSSRHSEVIHAGIYYEPSSLKAETCVAGRRMLYRYLDEHRVEYQKISKLIFASGREGRFQLERLLQRGHENGVEGLSLVGGYDLKSLEPELRADHALLSEETGIFDSHGYLRALEHDAGTFGAMLALETSFQWARRSRGGWNVSLESQGETYQVEAAQVINCAGHGAHQVAQMIEGFPQDALPPRFLARGTYWSTTQKLPFQRLLYPIPTQAGLGIHLTYDLAGAARFGPDVEWVESEDYGITLERKAHFEAAIRDYFPSLDEELLEPGYSGIRPKIVGPGEASGDFMIQSHRDHGCQGVVNLFGIESPGLTASLALAERVAERMGA